MKRAILLIPGWLAITAVLFIAIAGLDMHWNFLNWSLAWNLEVLAYLLTIAGVLLATFFLARATRDRVSRIASLVACLALIAVAILLLPEHTSRGLLGRTVVSPLWYRAGRTLVLSLPAIFWIWWARPQPRLQTVDGLGSVHDPEMKKPEKDTLTLWYCFTAFGVVTSTVLAEFAGIRFVYTIWITVPLFLVLGSLLMSSRLKQVAMRIKAKNVTFHTINLHGIGAIAQGPEAWTVQVQLQDEEGSQLTVPVRVAAGEEGPTERQSQILRDLQMRFREIRPMLIERLQELDQGAPLSTMVTLKDFSIHLNPDDDPEDMEICFESRNGSDMLYVITLKDWKIVDMYGAD